MSKLINETIEAFDLFSQGVLSEEDIYNGIQSGLISESLFDELAGTYLEENEILSEGKLYSQWRAYRNDKKFDRAIASGKLYKAEKYGQRAIDRTDEVLAYLRGKQSRLEANNANFVRKWWNNRKIEKHEALKRIREKKLAKTVDLAYSR